MIELHGQKYETEEIQCCSQGQNCEAKTKAKDRTLEAKTKAKDRSLEAKTKAKDRTLEDKAEATTLEAKASTLLVKSGIA
jgi:hypothetical protein